MKYTEPDTDFIQYLKKDCDSTLSTCMQCGSCTAVCEVSPAMNPFPRKEMIWASWGLKERLISDPDIWLCYQCGDCSASCPRKVRPGDVLSSIRKYCYLYYSRPQILGKLLHKSKYLPLVILFPAIIIFIILALAGTFKIPEGPVDYSLFFPHALLNTSFTIITIVFYLSFISGLREFWNKLPSPKILSANNKRGFGSFLKIIKDIFYHSTFSSCKTNRFRRLAHLLMFYGFIILLIVTFFAILATLFFEYPMPFLHPVKIMGNVAGLSMIAGCFIMIWNRIFNRKNKSNSNYFDWFFLLSVLFLAFSGFLVEVARFQNWFLAYHIYFLHLVLVWMVIMYLPYTKFAHIIFRILALINAKQYDS